MTPSATRFRRLLSFSGRHCCSAVVWSIMVLVGCRLGDSKIASSPHSYDEQVAAVLKVALVGSQRDQVVRALEAAGIRGSFGVSQSTYYCDVWQREDGSLWDLDVALLFDEQGRLYKTTRGETAVGVAGTSAKHSSNEAATSTSPSSSNRAATTSQAPASPGSRLRDDTSIIDPVPGG